MKVILTCFEELVNWAHPAVQYHSCTLPMRNWPFIWPQIASLAPAKYLWELNQSSDELRLRVRVTGTIPNDCTPFFDIWYMPFRNFAMPFSCHFFFGYCIASLISHHAWHDIWYRLSVSLTYDLWYPVWALYSMSSLSCTWGQSAVCIYSTAWVYQFFLCKAFLMAYLTSDPKTWIKIAYFAPEFIES